MVNVEELILPNWLVPRKNIEVDQPLRPVKTVSVQDLTAVPAPKKMANRHEKEFKKSQRSFFQQVIEKDEIASRHFVGIVAAIRKTDS